MIFLMGNKFKRALTPKLDRCIFLQPLQMAIGGKKSKAANVAENISLAVGTNSNAAMAIPRSEQAIEIAMEAAIGLPLAARPAATHLGMFQPSM